MEQVKLVGGPCGGQTVEVGEDQNRIVMRQPADGQNIPIAVYHRRKRRNGGTVFAMYGAPGRRG